MTILELREKRAKAWDAAKAFLDSHRTDKGTLSSGGFVIVKIGPAGTFILHDNLLG